MTIVSEIAGRAAWRVAAPWILGGVVALVLAAGGVAGWLYLKGRADGKAAEAPKTERALDDAAGRSLEAEGERATASRVDVVVRQIRETREATAALVQAAKEAPDAGEEIDPDSRDRLLAHDRMLCAARPSLDGCGPAAAHDAGRGGEGL